jgi:hypothetical protein
MKIACNVLSVHSGWFLCYRRDLAARRQYHDECFCDKTWGSACPLIPLLALSYESEVRETQGSESAATQ